MSGSYEIPLGFRFDPTDEELVRSFLYPRIVDPCLLPWDGVTDRTLYGENAEPWKVFSDADDGSPYFWHSKIEGGYLKKSIYVFTNLVINSKSKKKPNDKSTDRFSRIAGCGKWAGQTGPKDIFHSDTGHVIGWWKMYTFRCNKREDAAKYTKDVVGHWIMHEYSLNDPKLREQSLITQAKSDIVLCKITKWIELKNKNKNKNKAEAEVVQYHVNCNNKRPRSVGDEIIEEEEELMGNCNKKQNTSTSSSMSDSSCFDILDPDLQLLEEGWDNNIDMKQLIADFESNLTREDLIGDIIEEEDSVCNKTSSTSNSSCFDDADDEVVDYDLQQLVKNWDTTAMDQLMADLQSSVGTGDFTADLLLGPADHHNVALVN